MTGRPGGRLAIVIVGGGASGVLLAAHLLHDVDADIRVTLIEKRPAFGQGLAYSTTLHDHILNVSAFGMSAFAGDPEHFWRWLKETGRAEGDNPRKTYVPRHVYAEYLAGILGRLREHLPHARSLLMDRETLIAHRPHWVVEHEPHEGSIERLTNEERGVLDELRSGALGQGVRLEQERIGYGWLERALAALG